MATPPTASLDRLRVTWAGVRTHLAATGQGVEGIVVAREHDDRLRYAAAAVPGLTILTYNVTFRLAPMRDLAGK